MRTTTMRITNTTINRNFTRSINDVHDRLIKSINKVGSGKAYEAAPTTRWLTMRVRK